MEPSQPTPPVPPPAGGPQPIGGPQPGGWAAPGPYTSPGMPYAAGPYSGPPGAPGAVPYGQPPRRTTNGLAIGSLVTGIVCCLPPLGLVLGLVALPQIRKRGQDGKGLAITGIALSAVSSLLLVVGLATGGISSAWHSFEKGVDEAARSKSPYSLRTGQCFTDRSKGEKYATDVKVVDCARPHQGEVTGEFKVTGYDEWPGDDPLDQLAQERCESVNEAYAMDTWKIPREVWTYYYLPSSQSWRLGDRTVTCALATEKKPFSGSLRSDSTSLTVDQEYFLLNVNPIERTSYEEPEDDADEDFEANRKWAGELLVAIDAARAGMKAHDWPGTSEAALAALGKDLDTASERWGELAAAEDPDAYWDAYDAAWDALPEDLGAAARNALGLTDTLPEGEGTQASA
ncbi:MULTISPECIES: DUF4190 domain-containing protein [Streptomyces]|uniref:DUF4190 domain-containing protein n=1 Tax=Streptomyces nymphaeiformis TaxID=2663842 RepID=A0A7W7U1K8_9ACTN|nr:DUF4190 domain-containing protein [Streptomyces nymphaeiformis]MBB4983271.1 hypothetical protein [Streptomyces nymphaeiformis]